MRESNFTFPPQNRAVVSITHLLYDRRALDTSSHLAILNNLTSLTYLTSTSPRIRETLTTDGGLERLLDILRDSLLPRAAPTAHDLWGLSGPPTARVISVDRAILCRHSLAFQCVVNIGVRGSESIRTRVVQAGALDLVAQILESWLKQHGVSIHAGPIGSQAAVDAIAMGIYPVVDSRPPSRPTPQVTPPNIIPPTTGTGRTGRGSFGHFMASLTRRRGEAGGFDRVGGQGNGTGGGDTDVDMADEEGGGDTDVSGGPDEGSLGGADDSMEIDSADLPGSTQNAEINAQTTTPRASQSILPMTVMATAHIEESFSQGSSAGNSFTSEGLAPVAITRTASDNNLGHANANIAGPRPAPAPLNLAVRIPSLAQDPLSTQSSPTGTPRGEPSRTHGRRDTIVARPINLSLPTREDTATQSDTSDVDMDIQTATIHATIQAAVAAQAHGQNAGGLAEAPDARNGEDVGLVVANDDEDLQPQIGEDVMAQEQARLDMEAGAPPGQPGATQTPLAPPAPTPLLPAVNPAQPAQIIIANGAPRGFNDLGSYVGISSLLNPDGDQYSEDSILLSLQLLAYLSKYPHVRSAFHHPRRPMHPTFDLGTSDEKLYLPQRPAVSETPNVFTLVERFTFRPAAADPNMFRIPPEIQYWAGVIMRNACRKDEARGGIRQCANMKCGRWEKEPREFAKCRRCRKAKYCSKDCQSKAWSEGHKFWCNVKEIEPPSILAPGGNPEADDDDDAPPRPHRTVRTVDPRPPQWRVGGGGATGTGGTGAAATGIGGAGNGGTGTGGTGRGATGAGPGIAFVNRRVHPPVDQEVSQAHRNLQAELQRGPVSNVTPGTHVPRPLPSDYDPILPADSQLDLLRQTQRRLRTTTDEMAQRGRALGFGGFGGSGEFGLDQQPAAGPSATAGRIPVHVFGRTPPAMMGNASRTTPFGMRVDTASTHTPAGPGEAFSPLGLPSQGGSTGAGGRRPVVSGITSGRPTQMIPTSARTVSPLQPTFQIPSFGQGQAQGSRR